MSLKLTRSEARAWLDAQIEVSEDYWEALRQLAAEGDTHTAAALRKVGKSGPPNGGTSQARIAIEAVKAQRLVAETHAAALDIFRASDTPDALRVAAARTIRVCQQATKALNAIAPESAPAGRHGLSHKMVVVR